MSIKIRKQVLHHAGFEQIGDCDGRADLDEIARVRNSAQSGLVKQIFRPGARHFLRALDVKIRAPAEEQWSAVSGQRDNFRPLTTDH